MTLQNLLETFDRRERQAASAPPAPDPAALEAMRTEAFEKGYQSGWEDAQNSGTEARQRIEAEFERNIQNLMFTYTEAVDCVRGELKGFLDALIDGFLPEIVPDLTREHVRGELLKLADDLVEAPVEIVCAPDGTALLEELLQTTPGRDIQLIEDASLAARQVYIRIAQREVEVNVEPLIDALRQQLRALSETTPERKAHG
ncbi:MAG: hypothetical protein OIF48_01885 [Silicimonas sp.]|nr:hypothetical protein [Silicimonas sp.]